MERKKTILFAAFTLLPALLMGFDLVKNSSPVSGVKVEGSEPGLALGAKEITAYAKKVTGADISKAPANMIISTVNNKKLPAAVRNALKNVKSDEGFFMGKVNGKFYIVGTTGIGAWYGACDFMEKYMGVRWYAPYEDGTFYTKKANITAPDKGRVDAPFFEFRLVNQCGTHGFDAMSREWAGHNRLQAPGPWGIKDTMVKYRKFHEQRMRLDRTSTGGHLTFSLAVPSKKYAKTHPEYFALVDGKRQTNAKMLHHCITNKDVQELVYQHIIKHFETYGTDNVSYLFGAPDSLRGWCQCDNCRKLDGGLDTNVTRRFHLTTQSIAQRVWKKFPKAKIWAWAYWNYREVPQGVKIDPRTYIYFCSHARCYAHALDDASCGRNVAVYNLLKKWMKINKRIFIYEYGMAVPYGYQPYTEVMFKDLKLYKKLGLLGRKEEIHFPHTNFNASRERKKSPLTSTYGMRNLWQFWYLYAKACWNPDIDFAKSIAAIESDFYGKTYPAMKKYNDLRRKLWKETVGCIGFPFSDERTPQILQKPGAKETLLKYLAEAARLAKGDARLEKQIKLEKDFLDLFWIKTNDKYRESLGRKLAAPATAKAPEIDGNGAESVWSKAFYVNNFIATFDKKKAPIPAAFASSVGILSDRQNLYFLIQVKEPAMKKLVVNAKDAASVKKIWQDDIFEIFIAPQNNSQKYYQLVVNANGVVSQIEQPGNNGKIDLGVVAKAVKKSDGYVIEMKVPTGKMDGTFAPGMIWKLHIARTRQIKDGSSVRHWSLDGSLFHSRVDYRTLTIGNPIVKNGSFEEGKDKKGNPKSWSRNGKKKGDIIALSGGTHAYKLVSGGDLRQIPYGGIFMPKEDVNVEISFRASGKGELNVGNARFSQIKGKGNKFIRTNGITRVKLTPNSTLYNAAFTVKANEFAQIIFTVFGKDGECILDDVAIIRK